MAICLLEFYILKMLYQTVDNNQADALFNLPVEPI
jgi:hypothetical protein